MSRDRVVEWLLELAVPAIVVGELLGEVSLDGFSQFRDTPAGRVCVAQIPGPTGARSEQYQVTFR